MLHELWTDDRSTHGLWIPRGEVAEYAWILGDPDDLAAIRAALPGLPRPFNLADYRRVAWPKERRTGRTG